MKTGLDLLNDPTLNKGSAFPMSERSQLGLLGLLPPHVSTIDEQMQRVLGNIRGQASPLARHVEMISLLDRNETLFYRVMMDNIEEMLPIIYTPTVGQACQAYGQIFRRARGLFISRDERGSIGEVLRRWPRTDVRVIVVTDGERILGLGDLGASGMGIPVGKLSIYTACGGIPPSQTLPVMLDVGTNNEKLLADPLYLGSRERRLTGQAYDELVEEFITAVQEVFPRAMIQFEDFANHNAFRLLAKYRDRACVFNDDIQGTAGVTLAALLSAGKILQRPLREETVLFHGAGEAAIGIADLVVRQMAAEGLDEASARKRCWFVDSKGLVQSARGDLQEHKRPYAHAHAALSNLLASIAAIKPTVLVGVSGQPAQFTKPVVEAMSALNERPVIFALSNPTANSECTALEAYQWSQGRALFASGSPFDAVRFNGALIIPAQANNAYIFPGVGLGVLAGGFNRVTDEMFLAAARVLADCATQADFKAGRLLPSLTKTRELSACIAAAISGRCVEQIQPLQYQPIYESYVT